MQTLLAANALAGLRIGLSVSQSPDLGRLGLLEIHLRLALAEIARCVLVSGGALAYGGHLVPGQYTDFLEKELQKYGRRDRPLLLCLSWQEHRGLSLSELEKSRKDLGLFGRMVFLGPEGEEVDPAAGREEAPRPVEDAEERERSLTGFRRYMAGKTQARVLLGGKRRDFRGALPGLLEEALLSLEAGQPVYLAGGFGGVTYDITRALGVDDGSWLPRRADDPADDPRLTAGIERLKALRDSNAWKGLDNGLSDEENQRLAASHRPSDVAALVSLGLGRRMGR
jgi:hypothetical protein